MASIAELVNPSVLHYYYNYSHAFFGGEQQAQGPPSGVSGWIMPSIFSLAYDCNHWMTTSASQTGTVATLTVLPTPTTTAWSAMTLQLQAILVTCDRSDQRVWCVQAGM